MTVAPPPQTPLVVHVLPDDIARGAQVFARELRDRLDGATARHRTLALFGSPRGTLAPDHHLGCRSGRRRGLGLDPAVALRLRGALARLAPDVVVAHGGEPLKYAVTARPGDGRLVYYKIGSSAGLVTGSPHRELHRRLIRAADQVVAISHELADEVVDLFGARPQTLSIIPNGREPERFRPAGHGGGDSDGPVRLLYLAHLTRTKRPLWFVELVRHLHERGLPVRARMAGGGPLLEPVRQAAADLPVELLGRCRWDDVPAVLADSDILVFPSAPAGEGMPGAHIEAGLSGLPVVTTAVPGATTVVEDGVTGYLAPVNDLDTLVERTTELVGDPAGRRAMGAAARRRCTERFSLDAVAQAWSDLLVGPATGTGTAAEPQVPAADPVPG